MVPLWSPPKVGKKISNLNPLGAEAEFWLSTSNIGRGGGGGTPPPLLRCTTFLILPWARDSGQLERQDHDLLPRFYDQVELAEDWDVGA